MDIYFYGQPAQPARPRLTAADPVVTMRDGLVVEMKGCADRQVAVSYAVR
jgi:hypothetical protein